MSEKGGVRRIAAQVPRSSAVAPKNLAQPRPEAMAGVDSPRNREQAIDTLAANPPPRGFILGLTYLGAPNSELAPPLTDAQRNVERSMAVVAHHAAEQDGLEATTLALVDRTPDAPARSLEFLRCATDGLAPYRPNQDFAYEGSVSPAQLQTAVAHINHALGHELQGYTLEEARTYFLPKFPFLTRACMREQVLPSLVHRTKLDVLTRDANDGPQRHFLFAAHLAHYMLGAEVGISESELVRRFLSDSRENAAAAWTELHDVQWSDSGGVQQSEFGVEQLQNLQRIYPFIPKWEGGIKTESDWSLTSPDIRGGVSGGTVSFEQVRGQLETLSSIRMSDPLLEEVSALRDQLHGHQLQGLMDRAKVVEVVGIFADSIPRVGALVRRDGVRGRDIALAAKSYAGADVAVDVLARAYGVRATVLPTDEAVLRGWAVRELEGALQRAEEDAPVILHLEGVKNVWEDVVRLKDKYADKLLTCVSHTSSDGRDLLASRKAQKSLLTELMSMSSAKAIDEVERFRVTLTGLLLDLVRTTQLPLMEWTHTVFGYGRIMGPAAHKAFDGLRLDVRVRDPRFDEAPEDAPPSLRRIGPDLGELKGRANVFWSCAGMRTIGEAQLRPLAGGPPVMLVSLGSGEYDVDMKWIRENAVRSQALMRFGDQPVVEYQLRFPEGDLNVICVADGVVANLAFLHPTAAPYAASTPLLIWESMREGVYRARVLKQSGAQPLEALDIQALDGSKRLVTLRGLGGDASASEVDENTQSFIDAHPSTPYFVRAYDAEKARWLVRARNPGA